MLWHAAAMETDQQRPADTTQVRALANLVSAYGERHRHAFVVHTIHTRRSWEATRESSKPGCYALYNRDGDLLYIGKASQSAVVGFRLWWHFRRSPATWVSFVAFVQIIEVSEAYEAPSLEEYLIREMQPRYNGIGVTLRTPAVDDQPDADVFQTTLR